MKLCCLVHPHYIEDLDAFSRQKGWKTTDGIPTKPVRCHDCRETLCYNHYQMIKRHPKRIRCLRCFRRQIQPHRKGRVKRINAHVRLYRDPKALPL